MELFGRGHMLSSSFNLRLKTKSRRVGGADKEDRQVFGALKSQAIILRRERRPEIQWKAWVGREASQLFKFGGRYLHPV